MNRVEKRRMQRGTKKEEQNRITNEIWFNNLPLNRRSYIGSLIEQQTTLHDNLISSIMDDCFRSAMDDNLIASISDIRTIIKESNDYIADYKEYLDINGYEEGFDMIENTELKDKVKVKIRQYILGKMQKAKALKLLKGEFNLPNAELSDLWLECKDETVGKFDKSIIDKNVVTNAVVSIMDTCFNNTKKMEAAEEMTVDIEDIKNDVIKADSLEVKDNCLELIDEIRIIKGKFGYYHRTKDGIKFSNGNKLSNDDIAYHSKDELLNAKEKLIKEYLDRVETINKQIEELNNELCYSNEAYETMKNHFNEMEQVFDM